MTALQVQNRETLAEGNVNSLSVSFKFFDGWNNLIKTVMFKNGCNSVSVLLTANTCLIPWEVLQEEGYLSVSLRGTNSGGDVILCTEDAYLGKVKPSLASTIAAEHREATPDVIDALVSDVTALKNGSGAVGANGKSAYELAVENGFDGSLNEWLLSLHGDNGADGTNGSDGYTPVKGVDYFTETDKSELVAEMLDALPTLQGGEY